MALTSEQFDQQFNSDYQAAQPPELRQLMEMPAGSARENKAYELALAGTPVDQQIHSWNWRPVQVHEVRSNIGMAFQRPMLDPTPPIFWQPDIPTPPGCFPTVRVDRTDFEGTLERLHAAYPPPIIIPNPPVVSPFVGSFAGIVEGKQAYTCNPSGWVFKHGETVTQNGRNYRKRISSFWGMQQHLWLLEA